MISVRGFDLPYFVKLFLLFFIVNLIGYKLAFADRFDVELDSSSASDVSLSLLRKNYDLWAEEVLESLMVENANKIAPIEAKIKTLTDSENTIERELKESLVKLYRSSTIDETSVGAALLLAKISGPNEKMDLLHDAFRLAERFSGNSNLSLKVGIIYLANLLTQRDSSKTLSFANKLYTLSELSSLAESFESCLAAVLSGDAAFQITSWDIAETRYKRAENCFSRQGRDVADRFSHFVQLRLSWVHFRQMKYNETLKHLEKLLASATFMNSDFSSALKRDLSLMAGVSLSELSLASPPTVWLRAAERDSWATDALTRVMRYFLQKSDSRSAVRWAERLESVLTLSSVALDFYRYGLLAYENEGLLEARYEFMTRAVFAMHPHRSFARSVAMNRSVDDQRRIQLSAWARELLIYWSQQDPSSLRQKNLVNIFRVAETLSDDKGDVCSEVQSFILAHKALAAAQQEALADKVFHWFKDCSNWQGQRRLVILDRLEMHHGLFKSAPGNLHAWNKLFRTLIESFDELKRDSELRRMTLGVIGDGLNLNDSKDSERLTLLLIMSFENSSELAHLEIESLVDILSRLLVRASVSSELEAAAWSFLNQLVPLASVSEVQRTRLEAALAYQVVRRSFEARSAGKLGSAFGILRDGSEKFRPDSRYFRDLRFESLRLACGAVLENECLSLSDDVRFVSRLSGHDSFLLNHWRGEVLFRQGQFLSAAEVWLGAVDSARQSGMDEIGIVARADLERAGDIFSELKQWEKTLAVKDELTRFVPASSSQSVALQDVFLRWSLLAFVQESFDQARRLCPSTVQLISTAGITRKEKITPRERYSGPIVRLMDAVTRSFTGERSALSYRAELRDVLNLAKSKNGIFLPEDQRINNLVVQMLTTAADRWWKESIQRSEEWLHSPSDQFQSVVTTFQKVHRSFDEVADGCRRSIDSKISSLREVGLSCLKEASRSFQASVERFRGSVTNVMAADHRAARQFDFRLMEFSQKIGTILPQRVGRIQNSNDGMRFVERRTQDQWAAQVPAPLVRGVR